MRDPGTLWHTVVGERMLTEKRIITDDPFSFTHAGDEWIAHQWLGECAMALVHRAAGLDGLLTAACALIASIFALLSGRAARAGLPWPATTVLLLLVCAATSYHYMPRPHLITMLMMTVGTLLLCDIESGRRDRVCLLLIPPMIVLWSNIHGGALGGIASLLLVASGWLFRPRCLPRVAGDAQSAAPAPMVGLVVSLSVAAILVNPFGASLPRVWVSLMNSDVLPNVIIEHARTDLLSPEGLMIALLGLAYLVMLGSTFRSGWRITWLLPLVWLALAMSRIRHGPIFAFVAAVVILDMLPHSPILARLRSAHDPTLSIAREGRHFDARLAAICLFALVFTLKTANVQCPVIGAGWARLDPEVWPIAATESLKSHLKKVPDDCRVFNDMGFGGYLIYHAPEARVYIDDRCELYRDAGILRYVELYKHPALIEGEAAYRDISAALVRTRSPLARHLAASDAWMPLHRDKTASLFLRKASTVTALQTSSISLTP